MKILILISITLFYVNSNYAKSLLLEQVVIRECQAALKVFSSPTQAEHNFDKRLTLALSKNNKCDHMVIIVDGESQILNSKYNFAQTLIR